MGVAAFLVIRPELHAHRGYIWNLTKIGPVVSEKDPFENGDGRTGGRRMVIIS